MPPSWSMIESRLILEALRSRSFFAFSNSSSFSTELSMVLRMSGIILRYSVSSNFLALEMLALLRSWSHLSSMVCMRPEMNSSVYSFILYGFRPSSLQ